MPTTLPLWISLVLAVVATPRATRIFTRDKLPLICWPREAFVSRWGTYEDDPRDDGPTRRAKRQVSIGGKPTNLFMASLAYLWECDWCLSIWIGAGLVCLTWRWPDVMVYVCAALIASYAAGWNSSAESKIK